MLVIGDIHLSKKLPHSKTNANGINDRLEFRLNLLKRTLDKHPLETVVFLGDVVDVPDVCDAYIVERFYDIIKERKVIHVAGNHDATNMPGTSSIGKLASGIFPNYKFVIEGEMIDGCYYSPYHDTDENIRKYARNVVFGHWNFYIHQQGNGRRLEPDNKILYILGHIHTPCNPYKNVRHIGCLSPSKFGERQGYYLVGDQAHYYEDGERFIEDSYEKDIIREPNTFYRIKFDPLKDDPTTTEGVYLIPIVAKEEKHQIKTQGEEEVINQVAEEKGYRNVYSTHLRVREELIV